MADEYKNGLFKANASLDKFMSGGFGGALSSFASSIGTSQAIGSNLSSSTVNAASIAKQASKALEMVPGIGQFAKIGNMATGMMNTLGLGNDGVTRIDAIMGSTPLGFLNFGVHKLNKFGMDKEANSTGAFMGSTTANQKAADVAGKTLGWMSGGKSKRKLNSQIEAARVRQNKMSDIVSENKNMLNALPTLSQDLNLSNQLKKQGGFQPIAVGKSGMKLDKDYAEKLLARRGKIELNKEKQNEDKSFIPGGALHAHRHHLNKHDDDLANAVTNKGVPVVTFEEGGEIEQHAEIERGEIIFRLEVSKKLEELWEDGSEEAMIEAGKLIAEEVVNNTTDKSGEYEIKN